MIWQKELGGFKMKLGTRMESEKKYQNYGEL